ncbi:mechanosensitive ion channel [Flavihumibacter rivuli]|uniref:mechanosensitive ion channel family protein n=1 Tax=Flavihumibacter rivuli TaxID=2838156 RepID=UPI001BDF1D96|nr:mechanosensitive ion channel domain-containing protein [Flavihumibacter rivuli]ULQ55959.1 mechanosensitive ion channel [Flavihumibacter rivuli]
MHHHFLAKTFLLLLLLCGSYKALSQQDSSATPLPKDKVKTNFVGKVQELAEQEKARSVERYNAGRVAIRQQQVMNEIKRTEQQVQAYLKKGIDTARVKQEMDFVRNALAVVRDGIFVNKGSAQTQRNLAVSSSVLKDLISLTVQDKERVDEHVEDLVRFKDRIDSLNSDPSLYAFPSDSAQILKLVKRMGVVVKEIAPIDTALDKSFNSVRDLQTEVDLLVYELRSTLVDIDLYENELADHLADRDFVNIWEPSTYDRPLGEIINFSRAKERMALNFYLADNKFKLLMLLLAMLASYYLYRTIRERMEGEGRLETNSRSQLVLHAPLLTSLVIVPSLLQFIFWEPPFVFAWLGWLVAAVSLGLLFRNFITPYWKRFWWVFIGLFVLAGLDNMVLQASRTERWFMLFLAIIGLVYGASLLWGKHKHELKERGILYFIAFMTIMEAASVLLNVMGRYNLGKILMVTGYSGLIIAILFLWTVRLINETLRLISMIYRQPDKKLLYIDFARIGEKVPSIFYVLLVIGWCILVGRNFYSFRQMAAPFNAFLNEEWSIGDYSFSINKVLLFLLVFAGALLTSRIVSFFASDANDNAHGTTNRHKVGLGSWILLVRIMIISLGLFLAFAASGFPLDKVTIVLGALSVGIGLGLQGLVSNLVSGLIIAFEKPVNVGDIIELNGKTGVMKSIGFRSSVIAMADGAHVVMPNGDLLNNHLTNWTLGKNMKRQTLLVGLAYGTDLAQARQLVEQVLAEEELVIHHPPPQVVVKDFASSSIDLELHFWVRHLKDAAQARSQVISGIDKAFANAGIVIPFPQQEVIVHGLKGEEGKGDS